MNVCRTANGFAFCALLIFSMVMVGQNSSRPDQKNEANGNHQQLSNSDKAFLQALVKEDTSEINLGNMALQKSQNPEVKQYVQSKILAADPSMRDGAEKIEREHGIQPPTGPGARKQQIEGELSRKTGKLFDNAYMNYEATQQPADVKLVDAEINSTGNSEVKKYATSERTPVEDAANTAVQVSKQISSTLTHYKQSGTRQ